MKGLWLIPGIPSSAVSWGSRADASKRSADFQSAVSRIFNPQRVKIVEVSEFLQPAECNSAIQQIENLRYRTDACTEIRCVSPEKSVGCD
jgi:hypothetical protein